MMVVARCSRFMSLTINGTAVCLFDMFVVFSEHGLKADCTAIARVFDGIVKIQADIEL